MGKKPRILVLGANGQVGRALNSILDDGIFLGKESADLSRPQTLPEIIRSISPDVLINAAAYTQVDKAESERNLSFTVNSEAPAVLAQVSAEMGIVFVHYSTDYVFNGTGEKPWTEEDTPAPVNVYGASKLAGEDGVKNAGGKYVIFRTSWVYDAHGKNFLNTMLRLGSEREHVRVVGDQYGAPTHARQLAQATIAGLYNAMEMNSFPSGVYNLCAAGETSWYGFAEEIFVQARHFKVPLKLRKLESIPAADYLLSTPRPYNSRLNCSKAKEILQISMPDWRVGVGEAIEEKIQCNA